MILPVSLELNFWVVFVLSFGLYFKPNNQLYILKKWSHSENSYAIHKYISCEQIQNIDWNYILR